MHTLMTTNYILDKETEKNILFSEFKHNQL